jgi:hypothetical protein
MMSHISEKHKDLSLVDTRRMNIHNLDEFIGLVYQIDDVTAAKVAIKVSHLALCPHEVRVIRLASNAPLWRSKSNGNLISRQMELLKRDVRDTFKTRVRNYTYDIIFHAGDNEVHTRHLEYLFGWLNHESRCTTAFCAMLRRAKETMESHNISAADWSVVSSSVLQGVLGKPAHNIDILVRPSLRMRIWCSPHAQSVAPSVHVVSSDWMGRSSGLSDDELLDHPQWFNWAYSARGDGASIHFKHVRQELSLFRTCVSRRPQDLAMIKMATARPFAWERAAMELAYERMDPSVDTRLCIGTVLGAAHISGHSHDAERHMDISHQLSTHGANTHDGGHCFAQSDCRQCIRQPGCSYCSELDSNTCYPSSWIFCKRSRPINATNPKCPILRLTANTCSLVHNLSACRDLPCTTQRTKKKCCLVRLIPLLKHIGGIANTTRRITDFIRSDILLKSAIAQHWHAAKTPVGTIDLPRRYETAYFQLQEERLGEEYRKYGYSMRIRLLMFRGLYDSVLQRGFNWMTAPVNLNLNLTLRDGAHRLALALALNLSHAGVVVPCAANPVGYHRILRHNRSMTLDYLRQYIDSNLVDELRTSYESVLFQHR